MNFFANFVNKHPQKSVIVGGIVYKYLVGGNSKNVIVVFPGAGQDAYSCFDFVSYFEKRYKVIVVNYEDLQSLEKLFDYFNAILRKEGAENINLYGLSLGGFLIQHYVRLFPNKVKKLIISHAGTTRSKTIINKVIKPARYMKIFLPFLPLSFGKKSFNKILSVVQSGEGDVKNLYEKYSTKSNWKKRRDYSKSNYAFNILNKKYLKAVFSLGFDLLGKEKNFGNNDLKNWKGKVLIIRTENDPLAQDDGIFKEYYPNAKVVTYKETGHLTPFIRFEEMAREIEKFVSK